MPSIVRRVGANNPNSQSIASTTAVQTDNPMCTPTRAHINPNHNSISTTSPNVTANTLLTLMTIPPPPLQTIVSPTITTPTDETNQYRKRTGEQTLVKKERNMQTKV